MFEWSKGTFRSWISWTALSWILEEVRTSHWRNIDKDSNNIGLYPLVYSERKVFNTLCLLYEHNARTFRFLHLLPFCVSVGY
jgi:hypothetical protein